MVTLKVTNKRLNHQMIAMLIKNATEEFRKQAIEEGWLTEDEADDIEKLQNKQLKMP